MDINYVRKTILLNQDYVNKALRIFHVKTEKEAVNKALETVVEESNIIKMHKEIEKLTNIEDIFK